MRCLIVIVILCLNGFTVVTSQLCLFEPLQRGGLRLYHEGDSTCFRYDDPCGGQSPEYPMASYDGGQQTFIKWQQGYNYYAVGFPGYMDLAVAPYNSDNWITLAVMQDEYLHEKYHAQNFTAVVILPNMDCPHCVLRIRYNSHKPGQDILYQCSDISIRQNKKNLMASFKPPGKEKSLSVKRAHNLHVKTASYLPQADGPFLYGFAYNRFEIDTLHYVQVSIATGELHPINSFDFGLTVQRRRRRHANRRHIQPKQEDSVDLGLDDAPLTYIADAILAHHVQENKTGVLLHQNLDLDHPPNYLLEINPINGDVVHKVEISGTDGTAINSLLAGNDGKYITFSVHNAGEVGNFYFSVGELTTDGQYTPIVKTDKPEEEYITFQWAEFNKNKNQLYVLMTKSTDQFDFKSRIYTFDIHNRSVVAVSQVDDYLYTFESMQYFERTGKLYALSPEHAGKLPYWHLVEIDPLNGIVNRYMDLIEPGVFGGYFGGTIFGGIDQSKGLLYHVLRVDETEADVIVTIDLVNKTVKFMDIHVHQH